MRILKNFPEHKLTPEGCITLEYGAGITMKLLYVNMKRLNPCGIIYTKLGAIINNDHAFGAQVVIRYPKVLTEIDNNGYYFEDYTGHLDSKTYGQDDVMQLGAGEKASVNDYTLIDGTAAIQFAYTLSL